MFANLKCCYRPGYNQHDSHQHTQAYKDLVIIVGGAGEDFDACRAVFAGFSREAYHMGPVGSGARTKLVINLILAGNRLALAEGLLLGEKVGLDMERLLCVVQDAACSSKTMLDKGPKMLGADYSPQGQIKTSLMLSACRARRSSKAVSSLPTCRMAPPS